MNLLWDVTVSLSQVLCDRHAIKEGSDQSWHWHSRADLVPTPRGWLGARHGRAQDRVPCCDAWHKVDTFNGGGN